MTAASAPGKVILFGEHAVVSGAPALGTAIDLRARVLVEDLPGKTEISIHGLGLRLSGFSVDSDGRVVSLGSSDEAAAAARYVSAVVKALDVRDVRITVSSEIPVASGLGSSAAIVVATLAALSHHMGIDMEVKSIAAEAHRIEKTVQGGLGSPMDTALAAYGGYIQISDGVTPLDLPQMDLVVGCTSVPHDTRAEVARVQELRSRYPEIVDTIFKAMGVISRKAVPCIKDLDLKELGRLMNINHGLLEAIGVGTRELSELVYAARGAGMALGAKLTGAGGGGCMIALPKEGMCSRAITAITQARGRAFVVRTGCNGVTVED
ncbi:MAG: mevalonate kinase [Methanothrix sp.]|uniref:mevalonate kinase n=1 Tax=Methanothrix sp. TaxID=90426 RepID=UPI0019C2D00B|nr:mevalonate kinase [Methanothrix sp.]MBC7080452.1 mevalonate kinase [Methanothrix sp.]NPU87707.1 mevalonate kinase [Methanothrix sp.]